MRSFTRFLSVLSFAALAAAFAHADTISTFSLSSNLEYGTATGSLTVDTTTGVLTAGSITASYNGSSETLGTLVSAAGSNGLYSIKLTTATGGSGDVFYLNLPISTLVNYAGGAIDTYSYNAAHQSYLYAYNTVDYATSGDLNLTGTTRTPTVAQTPEAASWILMLTGTLGLFWVARRQREAASTVGASA